MEEVLVTGGDHSAYVREDAERPQLVGRWGLRNRNETGRDLLDRRKEHGSAYVHSFFKQILMVTFFRNNHRRIFL